MEDIEHSDVGLDSQRRVEGNEAVGSIERGSSSK